MENNRRNVKTTRSRMKAYKKAAERLMAEQARAEEVKRREEVEREKEGTDGDEDEDNKEMAELFWSLSSLLLELAVKTAYMAEKTWLEGFSSLF
ncbi:MAG: hypothetical protein IJ773_11860 [Lachnospiraceae bacterium]|nr:hypothetical protein [Lachnospiraceae bacterium]